MYLFFDTETTGLPKNWKAPVSDLNNWPRLVQLAFLYYDNNGNKVSSGNFIVKPEGFTIPVDASKIHGITTEKAIKEGQNISSVLQQFNSLIEQASYLVAHNMSFDEKIMGSEFLRNGMQNSILTKNKICTMEQTTNFCAIDGPYGYMWPKLTELHNRLFGVDLIASHNALVDVEATAKCFWELKKRGLIKLSKTSIKPLLKLPIDNSIDNIRAKNRSIMDRLIAAAKQVEQPNKEDTHQNQEDKKETILSIIPDKFDDLLKNICVIIFPETKVENWKFNFMVSIKGWQLKFELERGVFPTYRNWISINKTIIFYKHHIQIKPQYLSGKVKSVDGYIQVETNYFGYDDEIINEITQEVQYTSLTTWENIDNETEKKVLNWLSKIFPSEYSAFMANH